MAWSYVGDTGYDLGTTALMTTIKVPVALRDRINHDAQERGMSAAGLIEELLDGYERRERMDAFGRAFRAAGTDYWDEFRAWDVVLSDASDDG